MRSKAEKYGIRWHYDTDANGERMPTIRRAIPKGDWYNEGMERAKQQAREQVDSESWLPRLLTAIREEP